MRVTLWQQFSSNHSADFTIVGTFETPEQAEKAADAARHILRSVANFWQQLSQEEASRWWNRLFNPTFIHREPMTSVERALSEQYQIEWSKDARDGQPWALDWIPADPDEAEKAVCLFQKTVIIENFYATWVGSEPFKTLLRKLGGNVSGWYEGTDTLLCLLLTCQAPDEVTARSILTDVALTYEGETFRWAKLPAGFSGFTSNLSADGAKLTVELIALSGVLEGFPKFLEYLNEKQCEAIEYRFSEVTDEGEE